MKYTSLIIDNNTFFRKGLTSALEQTGTIKIMADISDTQYLAKDISAPDVIFFGHHLANDSFVDSIKKLFPQFPLAKYILMVDDLKPFLVKKIMDLGIHAIIRTNTAINEIMEVVDKVVESGFYLNDYVQQFLLKHYYNGNSGKNRNDFNYIDLSEKEVSIIQYMAKGLTACEIASEIHLSKRTVEGIRLSLIEKTNTKNSIDLIVYGIRTGVIEV